MCFFFPNRERIIKKAVKKTVAAFSNRTPKIYHHLFYGAVNIQPQYLVIWYVFETDAQLEQARSSGLCEELEETTRHNLIDLGYPKEAFELTNMGNTNIKFRNGTQEQQQMILRSLTYHKATISFASKEDVDREANGDYFLYFH